MKYKIYAGLSGATYQKTEDYSSMDEALEDAYALAVEEYQSYEGCHGIMSWDDCREDLIDSGFDYDDIVIRKNQKVGSHIMSSLKKNKYP